MRGDQLTTDRLKLIPFTMEDLELLHGIFTNPYVRKYLWDDETIVQDLTENILEANECLFEDDKWGLWKIKERSTCKVVGFTGFWHFFNEALPQLIYALLPEYVGKGYATEAAHSMLLYAFQTLQFPYVIAAMDSPHLASQQVAERLGMNRIEEKMLEGKQTVFYRMDNPLVHIRS